MRSIEGPRGQPPSNPEALTLSDHRGRPQSRRTPCPTIDSRQRSTCRDLSTAGSRKRLSIGILQPAAWVWSVQRGRAARLAAEQSPESGSARISRAPSQRQLRSARGKTSILAGQAALDIGDHQFLADLGHRDSLRQRREHGAAVIALADPATAERARSDFDGAVLGGHDGVVELVRELRADIVLNAIVGAAGLEATMAALDAGSDLGTRQQGEAWWRAASW